MSSQPIPSPPLSPTSSSSPRRSIPDEDNRPSPPSPTKPEFPSDPPPPPPPTRSPAFPNREDCWSEDATRTLIDVWGDHYLQLNRGNLRQKHWQEVADAVNALHAHTAKLRRTDVQCKNRIDTTKKKFKIEKSRVVQSKGRYVSTWTHFESLDQLIGESTPKIATSRPRRRRVSRSPESSESPPPLPEAAIHIRKRDAAGRHLAKDPDTSPLLKLPPPWSVPVGPRSKRSGAGSVTERNFSVMAAAAAAMEAEDDEEGDDDEHDFEDDSETWGRQVPIGGRKRKRPSEEDGMIVGDGYMRLVEAIGRLGQIYKDVEEAKQRQMVELEKQRMQFAKDLEIQRMKVFMEAQVHLEKLKRANRDSEHRSYM